MIRLKVLREKKGLYQKDIASFLGVDRSTYVKYERGQSEPPFETIRKLADFFEVSVDYILEHTDNPDPIKNDITFDDFTYAFYKETKDLTEKDKENLLDMARIFKKRLEEEDKK